jgi:hypothetical protein
LLRVEQVSIKRRRKEERQQKRLEKAQRRRKVRKVADSQKDNNPRIKLRTIGRPLDPVVRKKIRDAWVTDLVMKNTIHLADPRMTRAAVNALVVILKDDHQAFHRFHEPTHELCAAVVKLIEAGRFGEDRETKDWVPSPRVPSREGRSPAKNAQATELEELRARVAQLERLASGEPDLAAQLIELINDVSQKDQRHAARWSKLYADFELTTYYDFEEAEQRLGMSHPATARFWRLDVAAADGVLQKLFDLAEHLFPRG